MHEASVVIARPQPCEQLVLIFHGVGSSAQDLAPLGRALAQACPGAAVVSVQAPYPSQSVSYTHLTLPTICSV